MALFEISSNRVNRIKPAQFKLEKDLQHLVETNLKTIFNCQFIASEFYTGNTHSGRIDTLALSEDNNPVIIEYKKVASSELINQSLYYLHWITDHKGDFQVAANKALGMAVEIDWTDIRVICIAPEFKKYDLHAVQVMGSPIELWQYRLFENDVLFIEEVFRRTSSDLSTESTKNPVMVKAGKKAALTRKTATYNIEDHMNYVNNSLKNSLVKLRDFIISLDESIEEVPKKNYIAYKTTQNFVCLEVQRAKIILFLKIDPKSVHPLPLQARDMTNLGHFGTGDFEFSIKTDEDFEVSKSFIVQSLQNIGG